MAGLMLCAFNWMQVFVSPYGAGEWSHKDFEAMLAGCVVVKPLAEHVVAYPNVYDPHTSVISTSVDFADLESKVLPLLEVRESCTTGCAQDAKFRRLCHHQ